MNTEIIKPLSTEQITSFNDLLLHTINTIFVRTLETGSGIASVEDSVLILNLVKALPVKDLQISDDTKNRLYDLYASSICYVDNYCSDGEIPTNEQAEILATLRTAYEMTELV